MSDKPISQTTRDELPLVRVGEPCPDGPHRHISSLHEAMCDIRREEEAEAELFFNQELDVWASKIEQDVLDAAASLAERYFDLTQGDDPAKVKAGLEIAAAIMRLKENG